MIVIVAVNAVQHHVMVVDVEQAVAHFDIAKADALGDDFKDLASGVFHRHHQMVEVRIFRRPLLRGVDVQAKTAFKDLADGQGTGGAVIQRLVAVEQGIFHADFSRLPGEVFLHQLAGEGGVNVIVVKVGAQGEILHV